MIALCQSNILASDLVLAVSADKSSYLADEAIKIVWSIDNRGSTPVTFDHTIREGMTTGYKIQRLQPNPSILCEIEATGMYEGSYHGPDFASLAPAKSFTRTFNLRRESYAKLLPGDYRVQFYFDTSHTTHRFTLRRDGSEKAVQLKSKEFEFRVLKEPTPSLAALLRQIEQKAGIKDLAGTLAEKLPQPLPLYWNPSRRKIDALEALVDYGNHLALPLIESNQSFGNRTMDGLCLKALYEYDDVNAADVRRILDKRFENGNFFVDGGWTWCLLEKHYDIENLPLIVKALQRANDQVERQNLRCTLRNVIYFGSRRKRKFFPYDFDAFQKLTDADLSKISEIWEKRKAEIIEASKHEVEHSSWTDPSR